MDDLTRGWAGRFAAASADTVRARIAAEMQRARTHDVRVGRIVLRPHQAEAVPRLREHLRAHGGALLADAVGLGKTFVALALAQGARAPVVVAPAALREMWSDAARQAGVSAPRFVSMESLSRGAACALGTDAPDLLIVDEAHHVRTPATQRYAAVRALAARTPALLLTATPVHNATSDLAALCALFLGDAAFHLPLAALQRHVVRRRPDDASDGVAYPRVRPPEALDLPHDESLLQRLAAVPAPVPAADGGVAQALCTLTLVRAWCSSDAALAATARRRLATAHALTAALESGRHPTRRELRAWQYAEGTLQLAMPGLVLHPAESRQDAGRSPELHAALLASVREHAGALADLVRTLAAASPRDAARARHLLALGAQRDFAPVLAFSHSAHTVRALFRLLRPHAGVGVLTGAGAEIASGPISRQEALVRFALESSPDGRTGGTVPERDRIWLLLATDFLSEGLNLQHASAVVHLDIPWTAARLEQRVGRVARPGGRRAVVDVYAMSPPASGEALARVETRVRRKLHDASVAIGAPSVGALLSVSADVVVAPRSEVECVERVRHALDVWRKRATERPLTEADSALRHRTPIVAHACAPARGWLACLHEPGSPAFLLGCTSGRATTSACAVSDVLAMSAPDDTGSVAQTVSRVATGALAEAAREIEAWWNASAAARLAGAGDTVRSAAQHRALRRLDQLVADTPRHERSRVADLAAAARTALTRPPSAASDAWIAECGEEREDARWLRAIAGATPHDSLGPQDAAPGDARGARGARGAATRSTPPVVALLLLVDQRPAAALPEAAGGAHSPVAASAAAP